MPAPNILTPIFNPAHSLDRAADAHAHRVSIYYGDTSYSVSEAAHITRQIAQLLCDLGVSTGDRVMLISRNSPYHLLIHVACARIGAVFVPASYRFLPPDSADLIDLTQARVVITDAEYAPHLVEELFSKNTHEFSTTPTLFVIDDDAHTRDLIPHIIGHPHIFGWTAAYSQFDGTLISTCGDHAQDHFTHRQHLNSQHYYEGLATIFFTSGSTGGVKAVPLTHEQLWWGSRNLREGFEYSTWDSVIVTVPLSHIGGFNGTTLDLFSHGGTVAIVREFDPAEVLRRIEQHRVSMMFAVPTIYSALLAHPNFSATDLSSFTRPLIGGSVVSPALLNRLADAGLSPLNVWGMTEICASGFYLSAENLKNHAGSIGRPFAHIEARIIDPETGQDSREGELAVRGPSVIDHYWNSPTDTTKHFRDGWLLTGDLVRIDDDGYTWITGRLHNLINTGGEKVSPEEVEAAVQRCPGVSDAVVFGTPDEVWGEHISAAVIMQPGASAVTLEYLQDSAAQLLPRYKIPRELHIVKDFPLNPNGKVDRQALAKMFI